MRALSALLCVEAAGVLLLTGAFVVATLRAERVLEPVGVVLLVAGAVGVAAGLVVLARGVLTDQRWVRAPLVTFQLLAVLTGVSVVRDTPVAGGGALLLGLGGISLLALAAGQGWPPEPEPSADGASG